MSHLSVHINHYPFRSKQGRKMDIARPNDEDCRCRLHAILRVAWWTCDGHIRRVLRASNKSKWTQSVDHDEDDDQFAADPVAWPVVTGLGSDRCVTFARPGHRQFCAAADRRRRWQRADDSSSAARAPFFAVDCQNWPASKNSTTSLARHLRLPSSMSRSCARTRYRRHSKQWPTSGSHNWRLVATVLSTKLHLCIVSHKNVPLFHYNSGISQWMFTLIVPQGRIQE